MFKHACCKCKMIIKTVDQDLIQGNYAPGDLKCHGNVGGNFDKVISET